MKNLNITITDSKTKNFVARKVYSMLLSGIDVNYGEESQFSSAEDFISNKLAGIDRPCKDEYMIIEKHRFGGITISLSVKGSVCSVYFSTNEHMILIRRVQKKLIELESEWSTRKDREISKLKKENEELKNKLMKSDKNYCTDIQQKTNESILVKMKDSTVKCKCCDQTFQQ